MSDNSVEQPTSKPKGLLKSSLLVGVMTMLSRVLGLARDIVIANYFGAKAEADAFFVAFKIPNFLRRLFAEGAFSQAFVPVLSEYKTKRSFAEVQLLIASTAGTLATILMLTTLVGVLLAPWLVMLFAPGFHDMPEKMALAGELLRLTFPYLLLISLTAFAGSVLNSFGRFAVPAFTPVLLNISLIGCAIFLSPYLDVPVMALAWGVVIAGVVQLVFQLPFLANIHCLPGPRWGAKHEGVKRIMKLMLPALFGVSVSQINLLLDTVLASFLVSGSVSWLYYSDRLSELPLGIFGIAIATVILPSLSHKHAADSKEAFAKTLDWAVRMVLLIGLPSAVALFILAEPLLATLFHHGQMTDNDVYMASLSLRAYASGLLAFMLIKVLAPGYYARQDTKTPVGIAIKAMIANMVFNLILVYPLKHTGLALATSLSAFFNAGLLFLGLYRSQVFQLQPGWLKYLVQLLLANGVMGGLIFYLVAPVEQWLDWSWFDRAVSVAVLVGAGVLVYALVLLLVGIRPRQFKH
ncbi:murein biosynthesis integral membrane protein MurJ [Spartinivicinus poritis]|uniref:Probable lipid II flippase MurJ n=1 Tax=Spartinivicinus poritis TaxID=2994640 RepID=A0ABT5U4Z3_9GAMM|nr:murein biosynthesis integral membrane protein MurJ [Spartinivicinus sp. A2-2]MDE1460543.1 murein biosynthesis integral membrane protein MurJ [Spartinivicinus sp. A2-2]